MGFDERDSRVRVDFFKSTGKWYMTEAVDMAGEWDHPAGPIAALCAALKTHSQARGAPLSNDFLVVCLEPYHRIAFPVLLLPGTYLC